MARRVSALSTPWRAQRTAAVSAAVAAESAETAALRAQRPDAVSMARRDRGDAVA